LITKFRNQCRKRDRLGRTDIRNHSLATGRLISGTSIDLIFLESWSRNFTGRYIITTMIAYILRLEWRRKNLRASTKQITIKSKRNELSKKRGTLHNQNGGGVGRNNLFCLNHRGHRLRGSNPNRIDKDERQQPQQSNCSEHKQR